MKQSATPQRHPERLSGLEAQVSQLQGLISKLRQDLRVQHRENQSLEEANSAANELLRDKEHSNEHQLQLLADTRAQATGDQQLLGAAEMAAKDVKVPGYVNRLVV